MQGGMPSLFRFLLVLLAAAAVAGAIVYALATFVHPATRPMETPVPLTRIGQ